MPESLRVHESALAWEDGGERTILSETGALFSGTAFGCYPSGQLQFEYRYEEGLPSGRSQEWYPNGVLRRDWTLIKGVAMGESKEWFDDGTLMAFGIYDRGVELEYREWSSDGKVVAERSLKPGSPLEIYLREARKRDAAADNAASQL